jgi:hypothetical protein
VTARTANVLTVLGLAVLMASVSLTAPRWSRYFRQPLPATPDEPRAGTSSGGPDDAASPRAEAQRTISVKLFFESTDAPGLSSEERTIPFSSDLAGQVRTVVEELVKGPKTELAATLPPETKVLEVFVTGRGIAYVDLSKDGFGAQAGGSDSELRTVYSIVNSITANFPSIARVQILLDDHPAETLAGHVDLSRPLPPDMTLLAAADLAPVESPPGGATTASPSPPPAAEKTAQPAGEGSGG